MGKTRGNDLYAIGSKAWCQCKLFHTSGMKICMLSIGSEQNRGVGCSCKWDDMGWVASYGSFGFRLNGVGP